MSLPPQFRGEPAGVGARLAAFTIDIAIVASVTAAAWILSTSAVFGVLLGVEAILGLWILQARTGISPGKALMGLRVARLDAPYSPGAGRSFVRGSLVALGGLVFAAGAWVVEGSAAGDRSGARRSWADRAAQTVVIAVPRRPASERFARAQRGGAASDVMAVPSPTVVARPWSPAPVSAEKGRGPVPPPLPPEPAAVAAVAPPVAAAWGEPLSPPPTASADGNTDQPVRPTGAVPFQPAAAEEPLSGELLLIFDTGQRAQLPLPVAVNLGRNPEQTEPTDALVTVRDPDSSVSKTHLRLEYDRGGVWVTDAGSTNGTDLVDEDGRSQTLHPHARTFVDDDTRIRMGNRVFTVSRLIGDPSS